MKDNQDTKVTISIKRGRKLPQTSKKIEDVFQIWKEYSPYIRRRLLREKEFIDIIEHTKINKGFRSNTRLKCFIKYLADIKLLEPLIENDNKSDFGKNYLVENGQIIKHDKLTRDRDPIPDDDPFWLEKHAYYHPFQLFQFVLYYKELEKYHNVEKIFDYYYYEQEYQDGRSHRSLGEKPEQLFKEMQAKKAEFIKSIKKEGEILDPLEYALKYKHWLKNDLLISWIKMDSLFEFGPYLFFPIHTYVQHIHVGIGPYDFSKKE
ncbi:MAG: hypothetical protein ACFFCS_24340, partial [Candidatus Hodarchaeota archaeon]